MHPLDLTSVNSSCGERGKNLQIQSGEEEGVEVTALSGYQLNDNHHILIINAVIWCNKGSENTLFSVQLYHTHPLCLLCSCCCCDLSHLVQVHAWNRKLCFSAQLFSHLLRWAKVSHRGETEGQKDAGMKRKIYMEKVTESLQLTVGRKFHLVIQTENNRWSSWTWERGVFSLYFDRCLSVNYLQTTLHASFYLKMEKYENQFR